MLREFHLDRKAEYFADYVRKYSDFPLLVRLEERDGRLVPDRLLRAADLKDALGETNKPRLEGRGGPTSFRANWSPRSAPAAFRWGEQGKWNLEEKDGRGRAVRPADHASPTFMTPWRPWRFPISAAWRRTTSSRPTTSAS